MRNMSLVFTHTHTPRDCSTWVLTHPVNPVARPGLPSSLLFLITKPQTSDIRACPSHVINACIGSPSCSFCFHDPGIQASFSFASQVPHSLHHGPGLATPLAPLVPSATRLLFLYSSVAGASAGLLPLFPGKCPHLLLGPAFQLVFQVWL